MVSRSASAGSHDASSLPGGGGNNHGNSAPNSVGSSACPSFGTSPSLSGSWEGGASVGKGVR